MAVFVCDFSRDSIEIEFQLDFMFTLQTERWINVCVRLMCRQHLVDGLMKQPTHLPTEIHHIYTMR